MTAKLEIYNNDDHDDVIAWLLAEHVPRIGETINLVIEKDDLIEGDVADVVYMMQHDQHESVTHVCVYLNITRKAAG